MSDAEPAPPTPSPGAARRHAGLAALMVGATGVVFGDIGTSPLYTLKTVLELGGGRADAASAMGVLSLLVWTLVIITTVKYVSIAMRIDNDGEGGILALMALLGLKGHKRPFIVAMGLFGAALIYGDGAITPAISVLSALEGLKEPMPWLAPWIVALAVAVLVALFAVQGAGTANIGRAFGPVMCVWFLSIAALGLAAVAQHPGVLWALNPLVALHYLAAHGFSGFVLLGGVFLCVTGAEALYADMGHFGACPIRMAWLWLIFPALVLNYAGQAALLVGGVPVGDNIFYALAPKPLLLPLIALATVATIIASQAIITGAFSMTRQAIQLGWLPRLAIRQTSAEGYGQIYVGVVNWLLMLVTIALTLGFRQSGNLAAAYGIAVSLTMAMTSLLLFMAMRDIWRWPAWCAAVVAAPLMLIDISFVAANSLKLAQGGYIPLLLASAVYFAMWTWHHGTLAIAAALKDAVVSVAGLKAELAAHKVPRTPGTAVFLTRTDAGVPALLLWHIRQNRVLRKQVVIVRLAVQQVPWVSAGERMTVTALAPALWRVEARHGFMERADVPAVIAACEGTTGPIDLDDVTYYFGHEVLVPRQGRGAMAGWLREIFAFMMRNSARATSYFQLPPDQTVEIGRTVAI